MLLCSKIGSESLIVFHDLVCLIRDKCSTYRVTFFSYEALFFQNSCRNFLVNVIILRTCITNTSTNFQGTFFLLSFSLYPFLFVFSSQYTGEREIRRGFTSENPSQLSVWIMVIHNFIPKIYTPPIQLISIRSRISNSSNT